MGVSGWAALLAAAVVAVVPTACQGGALLQPTSLTVGGAPLYGTLAAGSTAQFVLQGQCSEGWLGVTMWDMGRMNTVLEDHADPLLIWRQGAAPQVNVSAEPRITLLFGTSGDIEGTCLRGQLPLSRTLPTQ